MSDVQGISTVLMAEKETKNTVRFAEVESDSAPLLNTIYVPKWVVNSMGNPTKIQVTVEPVQ